MVGQWHCVPPYSLNVTLGYRPFIFWQQTSCLRWVGQRLVVELGDSPPPKPPLYPKVNSNKNLINSTGVWSSWPLVFIFFLFAFCNTNNLQYRVDFLLNFLRGSVGVVRIGGPWTSPWGGPWTPSIGLVHRPGVSVFRSPYCESQNKSRARCGNKLNLSIIIEIVNETLVETQSQCQL